MQWEQRFKKKKKWNRYNLIVFFERIRLKLGFMAEKKNLNTKNISFLLSFVWEIHNRFRSAIVKEFERHECANDIVTISYISI